MENRKDPLIRHNSCRSARAMIVNDTHRCPSDTHACHERKTHPAEDTRRSLVFCAPGAHREDASRMSSLCKWQDYDAKTFKTFISFISHSPRRISRTRWWRRRRSEEISCDCTARDLWVGLLVRYWIQCRLQELGIIFGFNGNLCFLLNENLFLLRQELTWLGKIFTFF